MVVHRMALHPYLGVGRVSASLGGFRFATRWQVVPSLAPPPVRSCWFRCRTACAHRNSPLTAGLPAVGESCHARGALPCCGRAPGAGRGAGARTGRRCVASPFCSRKRRAHVQSASAVCATQFASRAYGVRASCRFRSLRLCLRAVAACLLRAVHPPLALAVKFLRSICSRGPFLLPPPRMLPCLSYSSHS